jgi:hypothetical protein
LKRTAQPLVFDKIFRQLTMDGHRNLSCKTMSPPTNPPPLSDVIDAYCTLAIIASDDPKQAETRVRNHVLNLQRVGTVDTVIYGSVAGLYPDFGCPLDIYYTVALPFDKNTAVATAAQKKVTKEASNASMRATTEFANKRKCIALEQATQSMHSNSSDLTTAQQTPAALRLQQIGVGCFVQVTEDLSPGKCSYGGGGFVEKVHGDGAQRTFQVRFIKSATNGKLVESGIPYWRITEKTSPFAAVKEVRRRLPPATLVKEIEKENKQSTRARTPPVPTELHAILALAYASNQAKGWRA